jgi:ABC-type multidrug transport system permease subunit
MVNGASAALAISNIPWNGPIGCVRVALIEGNFVDYRALPDWLTPLSRLTVNRWAMEGFVNLTLGGQGLADVILHIGVLFGMAVVLFGLAVVLFNRRFVR